MLILVKRSSLFVRSITDVIKQKFAKNNILNERSNKLFSLTKGKL